MRTHQKSEAHTRYTARGASNSPAHIKESEDCVWRLYSLEKYCTKGCRENCCDPQATVIEDRCKCRGGCLDLMVKILQSETKVSQHKGATV